MTDFPKIYVSGIMPCGVKKLQCGSGSDPLREEDAVVRHYDERALEGLLVGQSLPDGLFKLYAGMPDKECERRDCPRLDCPWAGFRRKGAEEFEPGAPAHHGARANDANGVGADVLDEQPEVGADVSHGRRSVVEEQPAPQLAGARITVTLELLPGEDGRKGGRDGRDKADGEIQDFHAAHSPETPSSPSSAK